MLSRIKNDETYDIISVTVTECEYANAISAYTANATKKDHYN